jgi:hypothetical protein
MSEKHAAVPPGLWKLDMPDGAYTKLPGDPPGPGSLRAVIGGYVYNVEPRTGRLTAESPPRRIAAYAPQGAAEQQCMTHGECFGGQCIYAKEPAMTADKSSSQEESRVAVGGVELPELPYKMYARSDAEMLMRAYGEACALAERERWQQDALRYRWLRANSTQPAEPWSTHSCPESLDEVVDAEMKSRPGPSVSQDRQDDCLVFWTKLLRFAKNKCQCGQSRASRSQFPV